MLVERPANGWGIGKPASSAILDSASGKFLYQKLFYRPGKLETWFSDCSMTFNSWHHNVGSIRTRRVTTNVLLIQLRVPVTRFLIWDRAEQRLRMCRDGRGLGSKLVSFAKGFSKHPYILGILKVDSEYLRFPFKVKVDYFILYSILVSTFVIFLLLFCMNKRRRTNEASLL